MVPMGPKKQAKKQGLIARITTWLQAAFRRDIDMREDLVAPDDNEVLTRSGNRRPELLYAYQLYAVSYDYQKAVSQCRRLSEENPIFSAVIRKLTNTIGDIPTEVVFDEASPKAKEANDIVKSLLARTQWNEKKSSFIRAMLNEGGLSYEVILSSMRKTVDRIEYRPHNSICPQTDRAGNFRDPTRAYAQIDPTSQTELASFALWQMVDVNLEESYYHDRGIPHLQSARQLLTFINVMTKGLMQKWVRESGSIEHFNLEEADKWEEVEQFKENNQTTLNASPESLVRQFFSKGKVNIERILADAKASANIDPADFMLELFFLAVGVPKEVLGFKAHTVIRDMITVAIDNYYQLLSKIQGRLFVACRKLIDFELLLNGILPEDVPYRIEGGKFEQLRQLTIPKETIKQGAVSLNDLRRASQLAPYPHPLFDVPGFALTPGLALLLARGKEAEIEEYLDRMEAQLLAEPEDATTSVKPSPTKPQPQALKESMHAQRTMA